MPDQAGRSTSLDRAALDAFRVEFVRLLTEDSETRDRRRKGYNQAIFMADGEAVWSSTSLDMILDKFDAVARRMTTPARTPSPNGVTE